MATTTRADFGANTEAVDVAKEFAAGINGKTILVTGVNQGGIGGATAQALATQSPACLILAGRTKSKVEACIDAMRAEHPSIDYRFLEVDLSSQSSVRKAAQTVLSWDDVPKIDLVINSAGVMGIQERTLTPEGIELHLATNHVGHWLLTCHIMPKLIAAASDQPKGTVRIVNVSSASPKVSGMRWSDMAFEKANKSLPEAEQPVVPWLHAWGYKDVEDSAYIPLDGYNRSKVANVLFSVGATQRLFEKHGILSIAVHPGVLFTELGRNFPPETLAAIDGFLEKGMFTPKSLGAGASTSLVAALDPALATGVGQSKGEKENWGTYLDDCQVSGEARAAAVSTSEAKKLWEWSEQVTGDKFEW